MHEHVRALGYCFGVKKVHTILIFARIHLGTFENESPPNVDVIGEFSTHPSNKRVLAPQPFDNGSHHLKIRSPQIWK